MTIEMYSKDNCRQCDMSVKKLDKLGLDYSKSNVSHDEDALTFVKNLGYLAAPVFVVKDEAGEIVKHWSGFRPDEIESLTLINA